MEARTLVVVEDMVGAAVRAEMVRHRLRRVRTRNFVKPLVAAVLRRPLEKLEVHHVVGDDEEVVLLVKRAPAANKPKAGVEALRERRRRLAQEIIVLVSPEKTTGVAERAVHDEADVVVVGDLRVRRNGLGPDNRPVLEELVARRLVEIPERPREMARRPPIDRAHVWLAVLRVPTVRDKALAVRLVAIRHGILRIAGIHQRRRRGVDSAVVRGAFFEDDGNLFVKLDLSRRGENCREDESSQHVDLPIVEVSDTAHYIKTRRPRHVRRGVIQFLHNTNLS